MMNGLSTSGSVYPDLCLEEGNIVPCSSTTKYAPAMMLRAHGHGTASLGTRLALALGDILGFDITGATSAMRLVRPALHLREGPARVEHRQTYGCDKDHDAVEDDEIRLVLHNGIAPTVGHLGDTVDTADEDGQEGNEDGGHEEFEGAAAQ